MSKFCELCGNPSIQKLGRKKSKNRCFDCYPVFRKASKLFYAAMARAHSNNLEFSLTKAFIEKHLTLPCERTGVELDLSSDAGGTNFLNRKPFSPSLDRKDPDKGYTEENVQFVAWWYNMAKQRHCDEDLLSWFELAVNFAKKKNNIGETQSTLPEVRE